MAEAGLSEDQKAALRGRDRARIGLSAGPKDPLRPPPWPSEKLKIVSVTPAKGEEGAVFELTVVGQWFESQVTCKLVKGQHILDATVTAVTVGERSILTAKVALDPSADGRSWDVRVANGANDYDTMPEAFEA